MFVVCGEALMDVFAVGESAAGVALDARVGGSPFNVAIGLARLGQPVAFLSSVSRDFLGDRLVRALDAEGVRTDTVRRVDAPTTLSLVGLNAAGVPGYVFLGHGAADRQLDAAALDSLPQTTAAIHVGSYATVVEPVASTLRQLIQRDRDRRLIAYDPNVRLNVEPDLERWRAMLGWMLPRCHVLKISDEDLALLHPGMSPQAFIGQAIGHGVELAVVTRGGEGAIGATRSSMAQAGARSVEVIDTVGAGDTFQAALLAWLAERGALAASALRALVEADLGAALAFAAEAAALTCSRRGADLPRRAELGP